MKQISKKIHSLVFKRLKSQVISQILPLAKTSELTNQTSNIEGS